MQLHHQDSFESEVYVGSNNHIVIKQVVGLDQRDRICDQDETIVFLTPLQAEQLLEVLPELILKSKFNSMNVVEVQDEN